MVIQRRLNADEIRNMNPLNRQMYDMITTFGDGYKASAISPEMAEAINGATNGMAATLGLSDTQELSAKLIAIKGKANIKDKEGLKEYFKLLLKKRIKESLREAGLDPELIEGLDENEKQQLTQVQEQNQNQDLFVLPTNGNGERIVDREEEQRNLEDRQKQVAERSLRVLEAMEKARDAIEKGKEIPEMDLSYLKDLTPKEFAKQMRVFKDFGLEPVVVGRDGQVREDPERQVTLETITREDIEQGDVAFAISFEKLQTREWRKMAESSKLFFKQKGIEPKYEPETTIEDDLINAIAGIDGRTTPAAPGEDDEPDR